MRDAHRGTSPDGPQPTAPRGPVSRSLRLACGRRALCYSYSRALRNRRIKKRAFTFAPNPLRNGASPPTSPRDMPAWPHGGRFWASSPPPAGQRPPDSFVRSESRVPRSERILLNFIEFREIGVEIPFEASQRNRLLARGRVRRWRKTFSKNIRKPSKKRCLPARRGL